LWPRLREMNMPVVTISGELDHKFSAISRQIAAAVPEGRAVEIAGAGHAAHLQQSDEVIGALTAWLGELKY
jgi:2-succinyl-6-hydroxy-2,4-cyclohexadiene-1-carboxylate synthase